MIMNVFQASVVKKLVTSPELVESWNKLATRRKSGNAESVSFPLTVHLHDMACQSSQLMVTK